jgi:Protein of unknown function (DUF3027)
VLDCSPHFGVITARMRSMAPSIGTAQPDVACKAAVDLARAAAEETAGVIGVGDHLGAQAEDTRVVSHFFACPHPGYQGWCWSVTVARAARARAVTVDEVVLLPGEGALQAKTWVPWAERIQPGDVTPGVLLPSTDDDPRLEPGYTGGENAASAEPAEMSLVRTVVTELGLGRERVLSAEGRDEAADRWLAGEGGPNNLLSRLAPDVCETCGFFVRLRGGLGTLFGICANAFSVSDGTVVSVDHGCGAHSNAKPDEQIDELPPPIWDTIEWETPISLFD